MKLTQYKHTWFNEYSGVHSPYTREENGQIAEQKLKTENKEERGGDILNFLLLFLLLGQPDCLETRSAAG